MPMNLVAPLSVILVVPSYDGLRVWVWFIWLSVWLAFVGVALCHIALFFTNPKRRTPCSGNESES